MICEICGGVVPKTDKLCGLCADGVRGELIATATRDTETAWELWIETAYNEIGGEA